MAPPKKTGGPWTSAWRHLIDTDSNVRRNVEHHLRTKHNTDFDTFTGLSNEHDTVKDTERYLRRKYVDHPRKPTLGSDFGEKLPVEIWDNIAEYAGPNAYHAINTITAARTNGSKGPKKQFKYRLPESDYRQKKKDLNLLFHYSQRGDYRRVENLLVNNDWFVGYDLAVILKQLFHVNFFDNVTDTEVLLEDLIVHHGQDLSAEDISRIIDYYFKGSYSSDRMMRILHEHVDKTIWSSAVKRFKPRQQHILEQAITGIYDSDVDSLNSD